MAGKPSQEKIVALRAVIASRKTRVASVVGVKRERHSARADCPVCGALARDVLRIKAIEGDTWGIVICDACGPAQGGLRPVDAGPDLVAGGIGRTAMLDQGDDDKRWEATDAILAGVPEETAEEAVRRALEEVEEDGAVPSFAGKMSQEEWLGGGLGPYAEDLYASEIFSSWPDRESWRVLCVLDAGRLGNDLVEGDVFVAVVNRGAGRGVWLIS